MNNKFNKKTVDEWFTLIGSKPQIRVNNGIRYKENTNTINTKCEVMDQFDKNKRKFLEDLMGIIQ